VLDLVVSSGRVIDGTGAPAVAADVGVAGGRIVAVGDLAGPEAAERVDATGLVVSPGFIDIHQHGDFSLLACRTADSAVGQGVTTVVTGNCGHGCAPVRRAGADTPNVIGRRSEWGVAIDWTSFGEYLERLKTPGVSVNVAPLVGHGPIRIAAMGFASRRPTPGEQAVMRDLVAQAMDEGAVGLSSGLEYAPGKQADADELIDLCGVAAARGGIYASHIRNRGHELVAATDEAIRIAETAGLPLQISHFAPRYYAPAGEWDRAMEHVYEARRRGVEVHVDTFPYSWGPGPVAAMLPTWAFAGTPREIVARLGDSEQRARIRGEADSRFALAVRLGLLGQSVLTYSRSHRHLVGKSYLEISELLGRDPYDTILDVVAAEGENFYNVISRGHFARDDELRRLLREPICMVESDGVVLSPRGATSDFSFSISDYGWSARLLERFVREERLLTLEEAVRRMTSLPAEKVGLGDRGRIATGLAADLVIFDPATIADRATFELPQQSPTGVGYVFVNGRAVVTPSGHTGALAGRVLRGRRN
jgi:N-acyl-D-amino-acid deacylase